MKVWVVYDNKSYSPGVFGSKDMAFADALEIVTIYAKKWGYSEEEAFEAVNELAKLKDCSETYIYLGELEVSIYERQVI